MLEYPNCAAPLPNSSLDILASDIFCVLVHEVVAPPDATLITLVDGVIS